MQIKKAILALLLLPSLAFGTKIVSQQTGNWGDGTTWVGGVVPGNGDEVSIFHIISDTDTRTVGVSVTSNSIAVNLNSTGTIHITSTGHLIQRGYGTYTSGSSNLTDAVDIDGGGAWEFDASQSSSPTNIHYGMFPSGSSGFRAYNFQGSPTAYASVYNTVTTTTALLGQNGQTNGGVFQVTYTSFTRMGLEVAFNNTVGSFGAWNVTHSSFTQCAIINAGVGANMFSTSTFKHEYNWHSASLGATIFNMNFTSHIDGGGVGVRSIKGNVFDIKMTANLGMGDFTIADNFMGAGYDSGISTWAIFTNNFVRMDQANQDSGSSGIMQDVFTWWDQDRQNAHVYTNALSSGTFFLGNIFEMSGRGKTLVSDDSGEFWLQGSPTSISTCTMTNSIFLADGAGYEPVQATSLLGTASPNSYINNRFICDHNTYFGGWDNNNALDPPFGMVQQDESSNMAPGTLVSMRDNLLWNPAISTMPAQFFKTEDSGNGTANQTVGFQIGPTTDVCNPSNCDYNAAYPVALATATAANTFRYLNQGRGYGANYSSTPGVHDISGQNPNFVDWTRSLETFDSQYWRPYFGLSQPTVWFSTNTYNQNDVVSHSSSTYRWGNTINYVYISTGFCLGANPEPGVLPKSAWNKCWQAQSLMDIQNAVASSATFTDPSIGIVNGNVNQALLKWIRTGYTPTNLVYRGAGHDGSDIGAEPVGIGGKPIISPSTSVVTVGGTIQFVTTNVVTWSLKAGSMGSINSAGLYTAPTTYFTAKNVSPAGCMFRPNDDVINTDIFNLPVDSNSVARFNHAFAIDGGSVTITFEPSMPTNIYNSGTPLQSMNFRSTPGQNGPYPLYSSATRMQEGSSIPNDPTNNTQDHHILGVDSNTCLASELYGYYPTGADSGAPSSNSGAGFQYSTNWYALPDRSVAAGGTDAAGMAIQPLLLRYSELKSGHINHAMRMTLNNPNLYAPPAGNTFIWPATDQAFHNQCSGGAANCFPYGARLRLKSTFNCAAFGSPGSQAVCVALQHYGAFLVDGSSSKFAISANWDVTEDTTAFRDIFTLLQSSISQSQLEQVNESSLEISTFSGVVNPSNGFVVPDNFAQVVVTNPVDGSTNTVDIALQPVVAGWGNPAYQGLDSGINVMAGTPQFAIPIWVNGSTDTTATCSMTPTIGTLTSNCLYTAPTSQYNTVLVTTVTVTSEVDPNHATSTFFMTVFSSDAIRVREGPAISGSDTKPPYNNNGNYQDPTTGNIFFEEPANMFPNWNQRSTQGSASWPNQLYNNYSYGAGDKVFAAMVPPGAYTLQANSGRNLAADVLASSNSFETQGNVFQSTVTIAPAIFVPNVSSTNLAVGQSGSFYWAIRGNVVSNHNFLSYWSLVPYAPQRVKVFIGTR